MSLTQDDTQQIAVAVAEALDTRRYVDEETHAKHHQFIDQLITTMERRAEMWSRIKERALTVVVISAIGIIGSALLLYFKSGVGA